MATEKDLIGTVEIVSLKDYIKTLTTAIQEKLDEYFNDIQVKKYLSMSNLDFYLVKEEQYTYNMSIWKPHKWGLFKSEKKTNKYDTSKRIAFMRFKDTHPALQEQRHWELNLFESSFDKLSEFKNIMSEIALEFDAYIKIIVK